MMTNNSHKTLTETDIADKPAFHDFVCICIADI